MLHRLRLAHRLLLIFLLSFVSVAVLAYSLIAEKNMAIEFTRKELRGSAYIAVVRGALISLIENYMASAIAPADNRAARSASLQGVVDALDAAEMRYGGDMETAGLADHLANLLRSLGARSPDDPGRPAREMEEIAVARLLISR